MKSPNFREVFEFLFLMTKWNWDDIEAENWAKIKVENNKFSCKLLTCKNGQW